ncbi:MAG: porin [Roseovarius sp.]|nr:porin [Roseovarius sp.]
MKKQVLSTSAIALGVAMAAPASAQEWDVSFGGFFSSHVAIVDSSGNNAGTANGNDFDGLNSFVTGEIIFSPSVTLDNGMTFGVNVQMEAMNNGGGANNIDETYAEISSDTLGRIVIGGENSAGYLSMVGAPSVTSLYINSPSISAFMPISGAVPFNFRQAGLSSYTEVAGNNDVQRLSYYTPSFNGLTVGVSYARNNNGNADGSFFGGGQINNSAVATIEDIYDIGVNYSGSFGATDVNLGARYGSGSAIAAGVSDPETWGVGASVGFSGFTIGGSYTENDNANGAGGWGPDQSGWSLGGTYDMAGPWAFEALTYQGNYENTGGAGVDSDYIAYRVGASRDMGPGVDWDVYAIFAEGDADATAGTDIESTIVGTALNLSF